MFFVVFKISVTVYAHKRLFRGEFNKVGRIFKFTKRKPEYERVKITLVFCLSDYDNSK